MSDLLLPPLPPLGICMNGPARRQDVLETPLERKVSGMSPGDPFRHIIGVMHRANERAGAGIYSDLGSDVLFDVKIVATDKHNRKGGLGTDLIRRSIQLARVLDFKGCKTEATGEISCRTL